MAKILIVDDEKNIRWLLTEFLQGEEREIFSCSSGEEAIQRVESGFSPDICILDFNFEGGYNGETLRNVLGEILSVYVVYFLITSDTQAAESLNEKFREIFIKPFSMAKLADSAEEALKEKAGA